MFRSTNESHQTGSPEVVRVEGMMVTGSRWVTGLLVSVLSASPTLAQEDSACTWDRCALREHGGFFGSRLVRGTAGERVANVAWFPPALPWLASRSDSAAARYRAFRSRQTAGMSIMLVSLGAMIAGAIVAADDGNETAGAGVMLGGLALTFVGGVVVTTGRNELSRAVWWYNRSLANPPPDGR